MLPVLLDLKVIKIYTFGVFLVLALFWGAYMIWKNVRLTSYKEEDIFDGLFLALFLGLFTGRLVHVVLNFSKFGFSPLKFILINGYPGLSLYGFLAGFIACLYLYVWRKKIVFREIVDYVVPAAFLALAFGKMGSFFAGLEVGKVTKFPLALAYAGVSGVRHLPALYESVLFFAAAFLARRILFSIRRNTFAKGFNLYFFIWFFAVVTLAFDTLKAKHLVIKGQSLNTVVSLVLCLTFSVYFLYYFRGQIWGGLSKFPKRLFSNDRLPHKSIHNKTTGETETGAPENTG